jgi:hypothetical protein
MVGRQILYRDTWKMEVGFIESIKNSSFMINFSGGEFRWVNKKNCTILPQASKPYTILDAYEFWKNGREIE